MDEERVECTMKAIIFSDSHGRFNPIINVVENGDTPFFAEFILRLSSLRLESYA